MQLFGVHGTANDLAKLRHQLSVHTVRVGELEAELEESERRAKGSGKSALRDSEDRFLREERLKDDLDVARRQKLALEAEMLDRDARAIEGRRLAADVRALPRGSRRAQQGWRAAAASGRILHVESIAEMSCRAQA